jgi:hypothetical protein
MSIIAHQFSPSISDSQDGLKINALGVRILAALSNSTPPAPIVATGFRVEKVDAQKVRIFAHGAVIETRLDHVWHKTRKILMGRIRFFALQADESLGDVLHTLHFDSLGNVNRSHCFTDNLELQQEALRDVFIVLLNEVHTRMETVDL